MTGQDAAKVLLQIWADWPDGIPASLEEAGRDALMEGARALMVLEIMDNVPKCGAETCQSGERPDEYDPARLGLD